MKYFDLVNTQFAPLIDQGYTIYTPVVRMLDAKSQPHLQAYISEHLKDPDNQMVQHFSNQKRDIYEQVINFTNSDHERVDLPVVIVVDHANHQVRVYHTTWPMSGGHLPYPEIIPAGYDLQMDQQPQAFSLYEKHLAEHDESLFKVLADDMYLREASGKRYIHTGEDRNAFYRAVLHAQIPAHFIPTAVTVSQDKSLVAGEYLFGNEALSVAGVAIWYLKDGLVAAVHIHDDADL